MGTKTLTNALADDNKIIVDPYGNLGFDGLMKQRVTMKSADYTYVPGDGIILVDTSSADVSITLPAIADWDSGLYRHTIPIVHAAGNNDLIVQLTGAETFAWGNTYFNLGASFREVLFGAINSPTMQKYGLMRNVTVKASAHRDAPWASSNFYSMTVIPWDFEYYNNQDEWFIYTSGSSARYTVLATGSYKISYSVDIDSTGGSTWNATTQIYKNGAALANTDVRTGNYGSEDQTMAFIPTYIDLTAGDYLDLRIDHNNLTGNLVHAKFNIEMRA